MIPASKVRAGVLVYVIDRLRSSGEAGMQPVDLAEGYEHVNPADLTRVSGKTAGEKHLAMVNDALALLIKKAAAVHGTDGYHLSIPASDWKKSDTATIAARLRGVGEIKYDDDISVREEPHQVSHDTKGEKEVIDLYFRHGVTSRPELVKRTGFSEHHVRRFIEAEKVRRADRKTRPDQLSFKLPEHMIKLLSNIAANTGARSANIVGQALLYEMLENKTEPEVANWFIRAERVYDKSRSSGRP
jgi:hypothetical protein